MLYREQNDETLVMLTLAGNQDAYEGLVLRYQKAVLSAALSVTHREFMAEDAAQDAFVTAWMKLDSLQEPAKFAPWVCRIAKNCALNMLKRYRGFLPFEDLENLNLTEEQAQNPAELYVRSEEDEELHKTIAKLSEKVRTVIYLHYFEGLSIAEIADRTRTSVGTVKWQLHDGRKKLRKELCAMNETWNDTLVQRVMKKVEELKAWKFKNSKNGFEVIYRDVLAEVEELPESQAKYHALADVLMRGWWWVPGEENDALFERIRDAAERGKNEEVMEFVAIREGNSLSGKAKIEFIRDKQIPRYENSEFKSVLARLWLALGTILCEEKQYDEAREAYQKILTIVPKSNILYTVAKMYSKVVDRYEEAYLTKNSRRFCVRGGAVELRRVDSDFRHYSGFLDSIGMLYGYPWAADNTLWTASRLDGAFTTNLAVGESATASDGTIVTFAADNESVQTPAAHFEGCQLWVTQRHFRDEIYSTWYKDGVGIVKQEIYEDSATDVRYLKNYSVRGQGLLPLVEGNTWEYVSNYKENALSVSNRITVTYADEDTAILSRLTEIERISYDRDSWLDMITQIRCEYWQEGENGRELIADISDACNRAEELAKTPMEKAHTRAACSVARRIMATDPEFNKEHTATGHWNFFTREDVQQKEGMVRLAGRSGRWSFEWKHVGADTDAHPLLQNDILGILQDATDCIWSDEWRVGAEPTARFELWGYYPMITKITCTASEPITTKAGTFEDCIKLELNISGLEKQPGLDYRGGKKEYYFARGIGIVRMVSEYCKGTRKAIYELTSFTGTGEGYMPMCDGLRRRYDGIGFTDGYIGGAEYEYVADPTDGHIVIFVDRTGIRNLPPPISRYASVHGETVEENLWKEGKKDESAMQHHLNSLRLMMHHLGRTHRSRCTPEQAAAWWKHRAALIESFGEDGEIPEGWLGTYADSLLIVALASFGCGKAEEGYELLKRVFELYPKWLAIPKGAELALDDGHIFGGIKLIKDEKMFRLPNGEKEWGVLNSMLFTLPNARRLREALTKETGWEWFDSVRNDERFQTFVTRAKEIEEQYK